jgi:hypothetical protein
VAGTGQVRSTRERIQRALRSRHARPGCRPMVRGKGGRQLYKKKVGGKAEEPTVYSIFLAGFCQFWDRATSHIVISYIYSYSHHTTYCFLTEQIATGDGIGQQ